MDFGERFARWFQEQRLWLASLPLGGVATWASYSKHAGPWRWIQEAQAMALFGSYSPTLCIVGCLLASHVALAFVLATFRAPPARNGAMPSVFTRVARGAEDWYRKRAWSLYAALLGLVFLALSVADLVSLAGIHDRAQATPRGLASVEASRWVLLDGKPLFDRSAKKGFSTYVPYVDRDGTGDGPGVVVGSGGDLGLERMKKLAARGAAIEALEPRENLPPDVRAYLVEHDVPWAATARYFEFDRSPGSTRETAQTFLALGLLLLGVGISRKPR